MLWELVDLTDWKTKKEVLRELRAENFFDDDRDLDREFRKSIEKQNELYQNHESEIFIAHSNKGYKIAQSEDEIRCSARDYRKRAIDQLIKYSKTLRALGENANMKIIFKKGEMYLKGDL